MNIYCFLLVSSLFLACTDKVSTAIEISKEYAAYQPVEIRLNSSLNALDRLFVSLADHSHVLPLQKTRENTWIFITPRTLSQGTKLEITQREINPVIPCTVTQSEEFITAKIENQEILRYNIKTQFPADSLPTYYKRSGFIHPLKTLKGVTLSADFPRGHIHQHGIFHAWTRSHVQDSMIDFWNQQAQLGDIRHKSVLSMENGPVFSEFTVLLEYLAYLKDDTISVSEETWELRIFPLPENYLIDWHLQQKCLGPDSIVIDEYHYGGAAFRGAEAWNIEGGAYDSLVYVMTSEGKSQQDGNHSRPEWVTMHGTTPDGYGGLTMFQDPHNFRYPQPIRIHPTMPYFCFAPMVLGKFILHPNDVYEAKFRILVFDGNPNLDLIRYTNTNLKDNPD